MRRSARDPRRRRWAPTVSRGLLALPEGVDELAQRAPDALETLALVESLHFGARHDHVVGLGRQSLCLGPERLAQDPLDPRALDGAADPTRDRETQPGTLVIARVEGARKRVEH